MGLGLGLGLVSLTDNLKEAQMPNITGSSRKREGNNILGLSMLASQKWWFSVAILYAPVRGM